MILLFTPLLLKYIHLLLIFLQTFYYNVQKNGSAFFIRRKILQLTMPDIIENTINLSLFDREFPSWISRVSCFRLTKLYFYPFLYFYD